MMVENKNKLMKYFQQNIIFIIVFLVLLALELFSFNYDFYIYHLHNLNEQNYQLSDATLSGFELTNGGLVAKNDDPNITFPNVEQRTKFIHLDCTNLDPEAFSQIYYRSWSQGFNEVNSVIFSLTSQGAKITLPKTVRLSNLRFDLTNQENDSVFCQEITINAKRPFNFGYFRLGLLLLSSISLIYGNKIIPNKYSDIVWERIVKNGMWVFILLIILVSTAYPLTLTFDSVHYLWLADLIKQANWESWDSFRNIGFPLQILFSNLLFGSDKNASLIPMIVAKVILYIFCCQIAFELFKSRTKKDRFMINLFIFIFIALDPTIVGYFQTLLTEYLAATIAVVSSFVAMKLYNTPLFSKRFFALSSYFFIMSLWSWHLKQDYVGAALFPFIIVSFLIVLKNYSWKTTVYFLLSFSLIAITIFFSTLGWNYFLESQGNPMDEGRDLSLMIGESFDSQLVTLQDSSASYFSSQLYKYFRSINFWIQDNHRPKNEFSLIYGFQNRLIAHRMYLNLPAPNLIHDYPFFDPYFEPFAVRYAPHYTINFLFKERIIASHFLFTFTYLVLPIFVPLLFILWIRKKSLLNATLLVLGGTSLLNALIHLLTGPIDRYLFPGYPLNLLIIMILLFQGGRLLGTKLETREKKQNANLIEPIN